MLFCGLFKQIYTCDKINLIIAGIKIKEETFVYSMVDLMTAKTWSQCNK